MSRVASGLIAAPAPFASVRQQLEKLFNPSAGNALIHSKGEKPCQKLIQVMTVHLSPQANWYFTIMSLQPSRCLTIWFDGSRSDGFTCRWLMRRPIYRRI
jgi:hypothetical protein